VNGSVLLHNPEGEVALCVRKGDEVSWPKDDLKIRCHDPKLLCTIKAWERLKCLKEGCPLPDWLEPWVDVDGRRAAVRVVNSYYCIWIARGHSKGEISLGLWCSYQSAFGGAVLAPNLRDDVRGPESQVPGASLKDGVLSFATKLGPRTDGTGPAGSSECVAGWHHGCWPNEDSDPAPSERTERTRSTQARTEADSRGQQPGPDEYPMFIEDSQFRRGRDKTRKIWQALVVQRPTA
jgi:hypothetical protein